MLADARLYVVSGARMRAGRLADLVPALAAAGVDVVQLRDRSLSPAALREEAIACAGACARAGILFVVNDDPALARAAGADGVHIGQADGTVAMARAVVGPDRLVGRSTRGGEALDRAADEGADYASVGPVWSTPTKPGRPPTGAAPLRDAARRARVPWFAIGGVDERRVLRVAALGATRCAVVRAVQDAADPAAAARTLRRRITEGGAPRVLTVAGSDSGGGAGLQADIRAVATAGGFPLTAVTALTAQTTLGVDAACAVDPDLVALQIARVADDIGLDGVKTGMLASAAVVEAVAAALAALLDADPVPLVVDPVMWAESGAALLDPAGRRAVLEHLVPRATVVTPNLAEARALSGRPAACAREAARALHAAAGCAVIVTGGHGEETGDVVCDDDGVTVVPGPRLERSTTHGAGCTHSATLATLLAGGEDLRAAAAGAKRAATAAVRHGRPFGAGAGPVDVVAGGGPGMG